MKKMCLTLMAMLGVFLTADIATAVEYKWTGDGFVEVGGVEQVKPIPLTKQAVTIPPGYHAHTRTDGSVFIHGDENFGKAGPHAGVERPWPKTGLPGQTVLVDPSPAASILGDFTAAGPCPNGVCPVNSRRTGTYTVTDAVYTTHTESHARMGLLARIAENARERRANRQSRRSGGGCP